VGSSDGLFFKITMSPPDSLFFLLLFTRSSFFCQGDSTIDVLFDQLFVVWHQIDTLDPQLSPATYKSCKDQNDALELQCTYDFLTRLRDEFKPLPVQLLTCHPCVSLMDALVEVCNEETPLWDAGVTLRSQKYGCRTRSRRRILGEARIHKYTHVNHELSVLNINNITI
jgi:hypothetical protein